MGSAGRRRLLDPGDRTAGFNVPQVAATRVSSVWANAGAVADRAEQQLTSFEGACNPACAEVQLAVHVPER